MAALSLLQKQAKENAANPRVRVQGLGFEGLGFRFRNGLFHAIPKTMGPFWLQILLLHLLFGGY